MSLSSWLLGEGNAYHIIYPDCRADQSIAEIKKTFRHKLATMSGLSYSTLNSILRGKSKSPTLGTLIRIASALNMTILEFLNVPEIVNFSYDDMDDSDQDDDESQEWSHDLKELICNERSYTK